MQNSNLLPAFGRRVNVFPNHKKWYLLAGSIAGIMCCVFVCVSVGVRNYEYIKEYNERYPTVQSPIRTLSIQIEENRRDELFDQIRKFSDKHHLEFHLSFYDNGETFYIVMYGKGLAIRALSQITFTSNLNFLFFEDDPSNPPSQAAVDELFNDLKIFISQIPSVKIIEEK